MSRVLITTKGTHKEPSKAEIKAHLKSAPQEGFWLDIANPSDDDFEVLEKVFSFHHLTIEDVKHKNQRPKLDEFTGYSFAVIFTAAWKKSALSFLEHHFYLGAHYVVTVHAEAAPVLDELRERIRQVPELCKGLPSFLTYLVIDALVDTNFPVLDRLDEVIDKLQDDIVTKADSKVLSQIYGMKHDVTELRRILSAQRDLFQRLISHSLDLHEQDMTVYWRDVYDHMVRQYETVDSLRDLLASAMDVYLSTVSNRLNVTMKTLTVIASLFLPLSFLTGFYGMNFAFLTGVLEPPYWVFWLGVATMIGSTAVQVVLFRRRGWL
jgi:magnesium transporter